MAAGNRHATVVVVGRCGILIRGPSGSGKSMLALRIIDAAATCGLFAALVADDQAWLERAGDRLVATVPAAIAGLVEIRGFGPAAIDHEPAAVVDRVVTLVAPDAAPRVEEGASATVLGLALPELVMGQRGDAAARAVLAWVAAA